jgi:hypothetical protein
LVRCDVDLGEMGRHLRERGAGVRCEPISKLGASNYD